MDEYRRAFNEAASDRAADQDKARRELRQMEKKVAGILSAIEDGMYHSSMKEKMAELAGTKASLEALLAAHPKPPALRLHPRLAEVYQRKVEDLQAALNDPELKLQATEILRGLISGIRLIPDPDVPGGHRIELVGELAGSWVSTARK